LIVHCLQIGTTADDANNELMATYGDAYAVLSDDSKRTAYDKEKIRSSVCPTFFPSISLHSPPYVCLIFVAFCRIITKQDILPSNR